jgi:hypothetical protein
MSTKSLSLLLQAKKFNLSKVKIHVDGKDIEIDLYKELRVERRLVNMGSDELRQLPPIYGFLKTIEARLTEQVELAVNNEERVYSLLFVRYKKDLVKGRPPSDDTAKYLVVGSKKYQKAKVETINLRANLNKIKAATRSFEMKKELLQTLSANSRKEKV